jgi:predicted kinase
MSKRRKNKARAALEKEKAQKQSLVGTVKIFVGLPGTGKSTEAGKYHNYTVISRDKIRAERQIIVDPTKKAVGSAEEESQVFKTEINQLKELVLQGKDVIIDDTNLKAPTRSFFLGMIKALNPDYKIEIVFFKESSLEDCIKRRIQGDQFPSYIVNMAKMGDWTPKETSPWSVQYDKVTYIGNRDYVKEEKSIPFRLKLFFRRIFSL